MAEICQKVLSCFQIVLGLLLGFQHFLSCHALPLSLEVSKEYLRVEPRGYLDVWVSFKPVSFEPSATSCPLSTCKFCMATRLLPLASSIVMAVVKTFLPFCVALNN